MANRVSHLFACEVRNSERRQKAAGGGEEVRESKHASSEIRRQILRILTARHGGGSIEAEGERDENYAS